MEEAQKGIKSAKQGTLDSLIKKPTGLQMFTRESLLHMVTQFIAVDDQVSPAVKSTLKSTSQDYICQSLSVANKTTF